MKSARTRQVLTQRDGNATANVAPTDGQKKAQARLAKRAAEKRRLARAANTGTAGSAKTSKSAQPKRKTTRPGSASRSRTKIPSPSTQSGGRVKYKGASPAGSTRIPRRHACTDQRPTTAPAVTKSTPTPSSGKATRKSDRPNLLTKQVSAAKVAAKHSAAGRSGSAARPSPAKGKARSSTVASGSKSRTKQAPATSSSRTRPASAALSTAPRYSVMGSTTALHHSTGRVRPHISGLIGRLAQSDRPRRYHDAPATAAISMPGPAAFNNENSEETFVDPSSEQFREASALFRMTKQAQEDGRKRTSIYGGPLRINKKAAKASQPRATFSTATHYIQAAPASSPSLNSHAAVSPPPVPHAARTPASRRVVERPSSTRAVPAGLVAGKIVDVLMSPRANLGRKKKVSVLSDSRSAKRGGSAARRIAPSSGKRGMGTPAQRVLVGSSRRSAKGSARRRAAASAAAPDGAQPVDDDAEPIVARLDFGGAGPVNGGGFAANGAFLDTMVEDDDEQGDEQEDGGDRRAPPDLQLGPGEDVRSSWQRSMSSPPSGGASVNSAFNPVGLRSDVDPRASIASLPSLKDANSPQTKDVRGRSGSVPVDSFGPLSPPAKPLPRARSQSALLRSSSLESASRLHEALRAEQGAGSANESDDDELESLNSTSEDLMSLRRSIESLHGGDEALLMSVRAGLEPCVEETDAEDISRAINDPVAAALATGTANEPAAPPSLPSQHNCRDNGAAVSVEARRQTRRDRDNAAAAEFTLQRQAN